MDMFVFDLPEVGEGVIEGELVKWLVSIGDTIDEDQPICELMTDKATIEITSPKSGLVHKLHCDVGDTIEVHTPLIEINTGGSAAPAIKKQEPAPQRNQSWLLPFKDNPPRLRPSLKSHSHSHNLQ